MSRNLSEFALGLAHFYQRLARRLLSSLVSSQLSPMSCAQLDPSTAPVRVVIAKPSVRAQPFPGRSLRSLHFLFSPFQNRLLRRVYSRTLRRQSMATVCHFIGKKRFWAALALICRGRPSPTGWYALVS